MTPPQAIELFTQCGALLEGHFKLSSGFHSAGYLQCALVLQHPVYAETLGTALADRIRSLGPAVVASPALGGIIIGHEVARALQVRAVFGERKDGRLTLRRGFRLARADRVIVVEDVLTTGGSTLETIAMVREAGGEVVGAIAIIDRGGVQRDLGVPFEALAEVSWPLHEPDLCPLCASGVPIIKPGSRPRSE